MNLRKLEKKDAELMLEWMRDIEISKNFQFDTKSMDFDKVETFIEKSKIESENIHLAIVESDDEYLGTISLKNIDYKNNNAEYAISLRKKAIGKNVAFLATKLILEYAFDELKLEKVYLNVYSKNMRAIKFYEKFGFIYEGEFRNHIKKDGIYENLKWYSILRSDYVK